MRKFSKKTVALVVSIALLLCVGIGTTLAYLTDVTDDIVNTFTPSDVNTSVQETVTGTTKSNVRIQNEGNIKANIRAAVVVTWQNAAGDVYGTEPVAGSDYSITYGSGWTQKDDGFYYWNGVVDADDNDPSTTNDMTGVLIESCSYLGNAPKGYSLCVEIIADGIQAVGIPEGSHPWFD